MNKKELFKMVDDAMKEGVVHFRFEYNPTNKKIAAELNGKGFEFFESEKVTKRNKKDS